MRDNALARCPGNGRGSVSGRGPHSERRETTKVVSLLSGRAPWAADAHSASPRTRPGPKRRRFPPCQGWRNGWGGGREQGGTGGSGSNAEIAPRPPAKPPGTMGSREGSPPPDTHPRGRFGVAGKAGRGKGAGVSRRACACYYTTTTHGRPFRNRKEQARPCDALALLSVCFTQPIY